MFSFILHNWVRIMVICLLVVMSGASSGVMEVLTHKYGTSVFAAHPETYDRGWWYPGINDPAGGSWLNKYKDWPADTSAAFFGSKTFLVFVTDAWHFFKFLVGSFLIAAILVAFVLPVKADFSPLPVTCRLLFLSVFFLVLKGCFSLGAIILWTTLVI